MNIKKFLHNIFLFYIRIGSKVQILKWRYVNKNLKIIGISGSSGKTSTMNALYTILSRFYNVKYSYKSNSETGLPIDILGIKQPSNFTLLEWLIVAIKVPFKLIFNWKIPDIYIAEMGVDGIDEPKNMKYLLRILIPDIAIYINVDSVHGENYEHRLKDNVENTLHAQYRHRENLLDLIAKDKNLLISAINEKGYVLLNANDPRVLASSEHAKAKVIRVSPQDIQYYSIPMPHHYNLTFEFAIQTAELFNIKRSISTNLLKDFTLEPGRISLFKGIGNSVIIDSSYNASKIPCSDLIEYLSSFESKLNTSLYSNLWEMYNSPSQLERIAVLGDMREIGKLTELEHRELAQFSIGKVDKYYLIGPSMNKFFKDELLKLGVNPENIIASLTSGEALKEIKNYILKTNNQKIILIKGSQNTIFTEIIVEGLLKNNTDANQLCRRGKLWDKQRSKYF